MTIFIIFNARTCISTSLNLIFYVSKSTLTLLRTIDHNKWNRSSETIYVACEDSIFLLWPNNTTKIDCLWVIAVDGILTIMGMMNGYMIYEKTYPQI